MKDNLEKIELTASDRNIIRFCVEESYKRDLERGNEIRAEISKEVYDKLKALRERELKEGTSEDSVFI